MSVYTDGIHLVADSLDELHAFAHGIYLVKGWFQDGRHPHYDLTTRRAVKRALRAGAVEVDKRTACAIARALYIPPPIERRNYRNGTRNLLMTAAALGVVGLARRAPSARDLRWPSTQNNDETKKGNR
jgi:hypothetical protein